MKRDDLVRTSTAMLACGRQLFDEVVDIDAARSAPRNQDRHRARVVREEHRGLAGRVAAADQKDVLAGVVMGFGARGAVVDAQAQSAVDAVELERTPRDAGRDHDGSACKRYRRRRG